VYINEGEKEDLIVEDGTESLVFPAFADYTWDDLRDLPKSIKVLYLGHDGVIDASSEDQVRQVLDSLPNLEEVSYCGYYSQYDIGGIGKAYPNIQFKALR
ncbi:hypothetical protein LCGC14_3066100, partial [marine sediment metagenome]